MTPRIAVLLEPFPIRNTMVAYAWIAEKLCDMLLRQDGGRALPDLRVICNAATMAHVARISPAARPYLIQPAGDAQDAFTALLGDWSSHGLPAWSAIQAGSAAHGPLYDAALHSARQVYHFDVLAYWGTNETLRAVADRLGVPVLWAEYGPLRPPFTTHFCLDPNGVNGLASSRSLPSVDPGDVAPGLPSVALEAAVGGGTAYEAALMLPGMAPDAGFARMLAFTRGQRRVVLLAMQLADDANIGAFGNGWTCRAMVEAVLDADAGPGTVFILRPHPHEDCSFHNHSAGQAVRDLVEGRPDVMVFDAEGGEAYLACLSAVTEVACINSSVGFEASMLGKPVRVFGQASYTPSARRAMTPSSVPARLDDSLLRELLAKHYIPARRFWSVECWRQAAADRLRGTAGARPDDAGIRLPTVEGHRLGPVRDLGGGRLHVDGLGTLPLHRLPGTGEVDVVAADPGPGGPALLVLGWGTDPHTGGMLAGMIVAAGDASIWCGASRDRPDVARHFNDVSKVACGFGLRVPMAELPSVQTAPVRVYGVTVDGTCMRLRPDWALNPASAAFERLAT